MRRVGVMGLGVCTLVAAFAAAFCQRSSEPVYAGKKLTDWLDSGAEPAALAVHAIGPAATPWILHKLRWEHPQWGRWETYQNYWRRLPPFAQGCVPRPRVAAFDEFKASMVLLEIGPEALPQLTRGLRENNPAVRLACAMTLDRFRNHALTSPITLDALHSAAQDEHPEVRQQVLKVIAKAESQRGR